MTDSSNDNSSDDKNAAYDELKRLLLNDEQQSLEEIRHHIFNRKQRSDDIAEVLSDSVASVSKDPEPLSNAMSPVIHGSIRKLISKDPQHFADALFPVMGPAIRKSINETLKSFMQSLNQVLEQNTSAQGLKWRFESWRTGVPYAELVLKHTLVYRVDEVFLIQPGSGLLIAHTAHPEVKSQDSDAVSAMLSAIQDFVRDSFAEDKKTGLDTVELGEHTLWVVSGPNAILACAIRGIAPLSLRSKLQEFLEQIHIEHKDLLETFDGDRSNVGQLEESLSVCLEEQRANDTKQEEKKSLLSPPLIIILFVILILFSFFTWRSMDYESRLSALKAELDTRQGIILYESSEVDDQLQLKLLVDPLADPIDALPEKYKFEDGQLTFIKTAYQSLEPKILLRRVKQMLLPPETVLFSESENKLSISGVAPLDWINNSEQLVRSITGYKHIDISELTPDYSAIEQAARTQLNIPDSVDVKFDGAILTLSGHAPVAWLLWYRDQTPLLDQVRQINNEQLMVEPQSLKNWLKSQLSIPDSIRYQIVDEQLLLEGNAPYKWLSNLDVSGNPWVKTFDKESVIINELSELDNLIADISTASIYFSDGTETVVGTDGLIMQLAEKIKRMALLAEMLAYQVKIDIVGYTDGLGTYKKNERLALKRADTVKQQLQDNGAPSSLLESQASEIELSKQLNMTKRRADLNVTTNNN